MTRIHIPRLMIAAPASGSGKTTVTCALLTALLARGERPAAFKCGPDYIDPLFHTAVTGAPARNLDLFLTPEDRVLDSLSRGCGGATLAVLEGYAPLFIEALPLTLEEIFIGEMEAAGYDYNQVLA